jgi:membrane protein
MRGFPHSPLHRAIAPLAQALRAAADMAARPKPRRASDSGELPLPAPNMAAERRLSAWAVVRETVVHWLASGAATQSAALAFYTLFSLAPVLVVAVAIAGAVFGEAATQLEIAHQVGSLFGAEAAESVRQVLASAARPDVRGWAGVVGALTLLLGASAVFGQLQDALNAVWEVKPKPGRLVRDFLEKRLLSFGLVLAFGFLLLVSLLLSAALNAFGAYLQRRVGLAPAVLDAVNFAVFFAVISVLFGLIYRVLPDAVIAWRDVAVGAVVTALIFSIGKLLIGIYLGRSGVASVYGVAGSLVLLLLWVYYSSMIVLLGAGFTRVWSRRYRPLGVIPEPGAARRTGPSPSGSIRVRPDPHRSSRP